MGDPEGRAATSCGLHVDEDDDVVEHVARGGEEPRGGPQGGDPPQPYTGLLTANAVADKAIYDQTYTSINRFFDQAVKKVVDVSASRSASRPRRRAREFQAGLEGRDQPRARRASRRPKQALDQAQKEAVAAIKAANK